MKLLFEDRCIEQWEYQEVFLGTIFTVDSPNVVTLTGCVYNDIEGVFNKPEALPEKAEGRPTRSPTSGLTIPVQLQAFPILTQVCPFGRP